MICVRSFLIGCVLFRYNESISNLSLAEVPPEYHEMANSLLYFDFEKEIEWLK